MKFADLGLFSCTFPTPLELQRVGLVDFIITPDFKVHPRHPLGRRRVLALKEQPAHLQLKLGQDYIKRPPRFHPKIDVGGLAHPEGRIQNSRN